MKIQIRLTIQDFLSDISSGTFIFVKDFYIHGDFLQSIKYVEWFDLGLHEKYNKYEIKIRKDQLSLDWNFEEMVITIPFITNFGICLKELKEKEWECVKQISTYSSYEEAIKEY